MAGSEQGLITCDERVAGTSREVVAAGSARLFDSSLHLEQQPFELACPRLLILLFEEGEFAQVMDVAQRMATARVGAVGLPAVVDADAGELLQGPYLLCRPAPPLGMAVDSGLLHRARGWATAA